MNECRLVVDRDHPIQADLVRGRYRHRVRLRRHTYAVGIAAARRKGVEGVKRKGQGTNVVDRDHPIQADLVRGRCRLRVRPRRHTRDGGMTATRRKGGERAKRKRTSAIVVILVLVAVMIIRAKR